MILDNLENMSDEHFQLEFNKLKNKMFSLFTKLNLSMMRLGVMSLTINQIYLKNELLEMDDILCDLERFQSDFYAFGVEKSRRDKK